MKLHSPILHKLERSVVLASDRIQFVLVFGDDLVRRRDGRKTPAAHTAVILTPRRGGR